MGFLSKTLTSKIQNRRVEMWRVQSNDLIQRAGRNAQTMHSSFKT
jgi:hypothetical protein